MARRLFVIKLSGSLFLSKEFNNLVKALRDLVMVDRDLRLVLVAGGGETARKYIKAGLKLGLDQATLDEIGIAASRLNARMLTLALEPAAFQTIPSSLAEIVELLQKANDRGSSSIVVCGGLHPGQSTNAVAALIAEKTRADLFINSTDVAGVFDKDPRKFRNSRMFETITPRKLSSILSDETMEAGYYDLMDPVALKLISRSRIPTKIVKCDSKVIFGIIKYGKRTGTELVFE